MLDKTHLQEPRVSNSGSNIETVARDICTGLYARHWRCAAELDADVDRHWHIVAALLEAGLMDESGSNTLPCDFDREMAAVRDWRARHPDYVVPPPAPRPKGYSTHYGTRRFVA
jgi:hypothetical protein